MVRNKIEFFLELKFTFCLDRFKFKQKYRQNDSITNYLFTRASSGANEKKHGHAKWWNVLEVSWDPMKLLTKKKVRVKRCQVIEEPNAQYTEAQTEFDATSGDVDKNGDMKVIVGKKNDALGKCTENLQR
uniref:Neur_chan_LBD domain-containing protein n=1 Tax=Rhabditophanes sp. KR3021 TaxID=114890 RepID=A0AC35UGH5_9BILA